MENSAKKFGGVRKCSYLCHKLNEMVNGRIDKYQFEEGYCQAEKSSSDNNKDIFTFCYYDQDHLGNIRQVREANGSKGNVIQTMNYYPFGAEFCDGSTKNYTQKHKYNGKEFDNMHGLNSYDYGARQYNPVTARWDRIDPLAEKYYSVSPYNYCMNNPVNLMDPDGQWPWERKSLIKYSGNGVFRLNITNFSSTTQSTFNRINNDPHYWRSGEIGLNTEVGNISITYNSYTATHKPVGIEDKQMTLKIGVNNTNSTGMPDRRFKPRNICPVSGAKGAGAMLGLNIAVAVVDEYQMFSSFWDNNALDEQTKNLKSSMNAVVSNLDLIPDEYRSDANILGAITNYVFQGINSTKNKDVEKIGKKILSKIGRYDQKSNKYSPLIGQ